MSEALDWEILPKGAPGLDELVAGRGERYAAWQRHWDALPDEHRDPFTHPVWQAAWFGHKADDDVRLFLLRRGGEVVTGIPLRVVGRLTPLGRRCGLIHDDDHVISSASIAGAPELVEAGFARLFATNVPGAGRPLGIRLGKVDAASALVDASSARVDLRGARSVLDVREGFEALLGRVSKNFRGNLRKSRNRLEKLGDVRMQALTAPNALADGLDRLAALEARSWKGRAGTSIGEDDRMHAFLRATLPLFAARDEAVVHVLRVGDDDVAAQLCLHLGETLHVFKVGYDESQARLSPGNLLLERCIREWCPEHAVASVNLVTLQPWHDKWKPEYQATHTLQWFAPGLAGLVGRATEVSPRERIKRFLIQSGLRKPPIKIPSG